MQPFERGYLAKKNHDPQSRSLGQRHGRSHVFQPRSSIRRAKASAAAVVAVTTSCLPQRQNLSSNSKHHGQGLQYQYPDARSSANQAVALEALRSHRCWRKRSLLVPLPAAFFMPHTIRLRPNASFNCSSAGAASHLDLWDFKPDLIKHHGEPSDFGEHVEAFQNGLGPWMKPVWEFKPLRFIRQEDQ